MISKFSDLNKQILVRYFNCFRKISISYNLRSRNSMRYIRYIRDYIKYSGMVYTLETFNRYLLESSETFTLRKFGQFADFPAFWKSAIFELFQLIALPKDTDLWAGFDLKEWFKLRIIGTQPPLKILGSLEHPQNWRYDFVHIWYT